MNSVRVVMCLIVLAAVGGCRRTGGASANAESPIERTREYRSQIQLLVDDPGAWLVVSDELRPSLKFTVVNTGGRQLRRVEVVCTLKADGVYEDVQVVNLVTAPGKPALLNANGGRIVHTVEFAPKRVNQSTRLALMRTPVQWSFEVNAVDFDQ